MYKGTERYALLLVALVSIILVGRAWPALAGEDICSEPNDSPETACSLEPDLARVGFLNAPDDLDRYRVAVVGGQSLVAILSGLPGDYDLRLERSDGSLVVEAGAVGFDDRRVEASDLEGGTYYLVVFSQRGDANPERPYTLMVSLQSPLAAPPSPVEPVEQPPAAPQPDRPLDQLVLASNEVGELAKPEKPTKGSDSRASWHQIVYKRDSARQVAGKLGPQFIVNRVYRAVDVATAQQIFREQTGAGLPETRIFNLHFGSLGPQPMDPIGEEAQAVGACVDCDADDDYKVKLHYRIVFRMGNLVETLYTYGPKTANYFGVAFDLGKTIEKRIVTPPTGPLPEIFSTRQPGEIGLRIEDAGKEAATIFDRFGSDDRASWYEARFERGEETLDQHFGPNIIYNKVLVANSIDNAKAIYKENAIKELPEATTARSAIFIENKTKKLGNESYAIGACNTDCDSHLVNRLHERLVFRWGNVVTIIYIWGHMDRSGPEAVSTFGEVVAGRMQ
jgi:hypothetical protein